MTGTMNGTVSTLYYVSVNININMKTIESHVPSLRGLKVIRAPYIGPNLLLVFPRIE